MPLSGEVRVISTHEQVLGGESGHQYVGCRFPARTDYGRELADAGARVGRVLARRGAVGRAAIDFVASPVHGGWALHAVEINLREGGTTHPFGALTLLTGGRFDPAAGGFRAPDGGERHSLATDRVHREECRAVDPRRLVAEASRRGLAFDPREGAGVVSTCCVRCPARDAFGVVAIGRTAKHADALERRARALLDEPAAASYAGRPRK